MILSLSNVVKKIILSLYSGDHFPIIIRVYITGENWKLLKNKKIVTHNLKKINKESESVLKAQWIEKKAITYVNRA